MSGDVFSHMCENQETSRRPYQCKACKWFDKNKSLACYQEILGLCRLTPPRGDAIRCRWATVEENDWCGGFEIKI